MKLTCLVEAVERARNSMNQMIQSVPREKWEWKPSSEAWSLKDVMAHIAWHDDQMIEVCKQRDLIGSAWWTLSLDERNANIYAEYKDKPLDEVVGFFESSYERMLEALKTLTDEDLADSARFHDMPEDWTPWHMLASNNYEHYIRHMGQVIAIRDATKE